MYGLLACRLCMKSVLLYVHQTKFFEKLSEIIFVKHADPVLQFSKSSVNISQYHLPIVLCAVLS